jgi:hypothetical protein
MRFISHLDWLAMAERILARASLPVVYSEGYHPRIIMKTSPPLPIGVESHCELMQIFLREHLEREEVSGRLSSAVPEGITLKWAKGMRFKPPKNPYRAIVAAEYAIEFKDTLTREKMERTISLMKSLMPDGEADEQPAGPGPEWMKPVAGRIIDIRDYKSYMDGSSNRIDLIGKMDSKETLHAAKLGFFLCESTPLERFPRIVKTGYLRRTDKGFEAVFAN